MRCRIVRERDALFVVDAAQTGGVQRRGLVRVGRALLDEGAQRGCLLVAAELHAGVSQATVSYVINDHPSHPISAATEAGHAAAGEVGDRVHALLVLDIDEQRSNPLALIRQAVPYPTDVLRAAGVPPVARDEVAARQFPHEDIVSDS